MRGRDRTIGYRVIGCHGRDNVPQIECMLMGMFTGAALEFVDTTFRDR